MYLSIISLASLWRSLYPLIVLIICLVYIFLLKPLDPGNYKSWLSSYIVEFNIPTYLGLYPSFLVFSPSYLGLKA